MTMPSSLARALLPFALCLLAFFSLPALLAAQERPFDAAEISRGLLYHPVLRIEPSGEALLFRAARFTYRFNPAADTWEVTAEKNATEMPRSVLIHQHAATGTPYRFTGRSTDDEGILEIRRGKEMDAEIIVRLTLWERQRLAVIWSDRWRRDHPDTNEEQLARELEIADPEVAAVADDGTHLWLAIRYYAGEGVLGIGTVVRFTPASGEAQVLQPMALATASVTRIAFAAGALWLGTEREGENHVEAASGLVRLDPATGETRSSLNGSPKLPGMIITALHAAPGMLWVGTDDGICRITLPGERARCWKIAPTVRLTGPVPVSNRPGGEPRGRLPAGSYEIRWANAAWLEAVTPDAVEGWVESDDFEDYRRRDFDVSPYELANSSGGGAGIMRLLKEPEADPLTATQAYRARLEPIGPPNPEGWQRVRCHIGWIARHALDVAPAIRPATN